ncbi:MAG: PhoH family protein [Cellvibrionaceae bacterium]|nr:PhoH family protein [Cellvibrionaceae bacterium]
MNTPKPATCTDSHVVNLNTASSQQLALLCGQFNRHLEQIEQRLSVRIINRGQQFVVEGNRAQTAVAILHALLQDIQQQHEITPDSVHLAIQQYGHCTDASDTESLTIVRTKKATIKPRTPNQQHYVRAVLTHDINFGIGPAGTGKTYLAVACAVQALINDEVERILLVRPAVEAGEKLGFLPGDLSQKVDPYLRPLYDALYEMLGFETVDKLIERNVIEVAPLAYMRGRTLNNAFIILDESQNTTREQMKMFLTRIGFGSTAVINGDPSQIDLPRGQASGLKHAAEVLKGVEGIRFTQFYSSDVVRHPLVQRIVDAYDKADQRQARQQADHRQSP